MILVNGIIIEQIEMVRRIGQSDRRLRNKIEAVQLFDRRTSSEKLPLKRKKKKNVFGHF